MLTIVPAHCYDATDIYDEFDEDGWAGPLRDDAADTVEIPIEQIREELAALGISTTDAVARVKSAYATASLPHVNDDQPRVPCPPLPPYDGDNWLTQRQHDAIDYMTGLWPTAEVSGSDVWIPSPNFDESHGYPYRVQDGIDYTRIALFAYPTAMRVGCWVSLDHSLLT